MMLLRVPAVNSSAKERVGIVSSLFKRNFSLWYPSLLKVSLALLTPKEQQICALRSSVKEAKLDELEVGLGARLGFPGKEGCISLPRKLHGGCEGEVCQVL